MLKFKFNVRMVLFRPSRLLNNRSFIFVRSKKENKHGNVFQIKFLSGTATKDVQVQLSNGTTLKISTGKIARFATGSVIATCGETSVMTTVVRKNTPSDSSIVPLTVNYRQKAAAMGRIPTNFLRREMGHSEQEILVSRIIDRSLRPLFDPEYSYETQLVCNLLAIDGVNDPDVLSINAASAALSVSDIPWNGPVAAVRIGIIDKQYVVNPSKRELQQSQLNLVLTSMAKNLVVMIEGSAEDILEPDIRKALKVGVKECQTIVQMITQLQNEVGKTKINIEKKDDSEAQEFVRNFAESELRNIFSCHTHDKVSRDNAISDLQKRMLTSISSRDAEFTASVLKAFNATSKRVFRSLIFETQERCDGRKMDDLRNIHCQVNLFQPLHGSALFQRGQTQVLCTVTLDSIESSLKLDAISMLTSGIKEKHFFLHYEFPPYAVNEMGKLTGMNRREIGHGALAEKGLRAVIPKDYPFAVRLTSEVLESNGSSSMASVCGGSLALMDAGIPISAHVAGVAMGLVTNPNSSLLSDDDYKILTDISGIEDYLGDMDFKIAGTRKGFTALQADIKIPGVPLKVITKALQSSISAKGRILNVMNGVIISPKTNENSNKPVIDTINVPLHQRGKFLGIGGTNLKKIYCETNVNIISEDGGMFSMFAPNQQAMDIAKEMIQEILQKDVEPTLTFGDIYAAKITEIRDSGVMISLYPTMLPTLLPNSQLDQRKIHHPSVLGLNVGDEIKVKYFGRDPVNGRLRLSRKVLQDPITTSRNFNVSEEAMDEHKAQIRESTATVDLQTYARGKEEVQLAGKVAQRKRAKDKKKLKVL